MTSNKAQKTATRQRMAETGEPYSVARKATEGRARPDVSETPEEQYLRDAEASGVSGADLDVLRVVFRARQQRDRCGRPPSKHGNEPTRPRRRRSGPRSGPDARRRLPSWPRNGPTRTSRT